MGVALRARAPCIFCQLQTITRSPRRLDGSFVSQPSRIFQQTRLASKKRAVLPKRKTPASSPSTSRSPSSTAPQIQHGSSSSSTPADSSIAATSASSGSSAGRRQPYMNAFASFTSLLASKPIPTTLYAASDSNTHLLASHLVAAFCISYGSYHIYDVVLTPHPGLTAIIPYMMGGVCAMMIAGGAWVSLSARRIIQTLEAVPNAAAPHGLRIRLTRKRLFLAFGGRGGGGSASSRRPLEVDVEDVMLGKRLSTALVGAEDASGRPLTVAEVDEAKERDRRERERESGGGAGARAAGAVSRGMASFGRIFSRDGFVRVHVRGRGTWRMDIRTGRCAEDGVLMERLFRYRTESGLFSG